MEATKSATENTVAPNLNLDINASNTPDEHYLAIEIKRKPFEGTFRPLNLLQGILWDDIIYNWILKTSTSLRQSWRDMPRANKKDHHHRFAIKYGTKKEMEEFRDELYNMKITEEMLSGVSNLIYKAARRVTPKMRRKINSIDAEQVSSYEKFTFKLAEFGIFVVIPIEKDGEDSPSLK